MPKRVLPLILLISALVIPAPAAAAPPDFVGMTSGDVFYRTGSYRSQQLDLMRRSRVRLLRQSFDWASIEYARGSYDFSYHDEFVEAAARRGIRLLGLISHAPRFYERKARGPGIAPPRSNESIARFARELVRRYGPNGSLWTGDLARYRRYAIRSWQVWNEPNLPAYWRPRPSARQYARMLRAVSRAIHDEHGGAEVVTAGVPNSALRGAIPHTRFIRGIYRYGGRSAFDTLAVNAYVPDAARLVELVRGVRRTMNARGDRRARIWVTELGWADHGPRHRFVVGRAGQAKRLRDSMRALRRLRRSARVRGFVWYQWRDQRRPRGSSDEWGYHTGLLTKAGKRKPAFRAWLRYAR